jgi:hypothetical protein
MLEVTTVLPNVPRRELLAQMKLHIELFAHVHMCDKFLLHIPQLDLSVLLGKHQHLVSHTT